MSNPLTSSPLAGKHVLVVGGTSGIGHAVAEHALAVGARVTVASRNPQRVTLGAGLTDRAST